MRRFCDECQVSPLVVAVHGHTVFHIPNKGVSLQLGHGAAIADVTGIPTVTDLRSADLMAGGQGAPFAPLADRDLFPGFDYYLNLGGIVNITAITDSGMYAADIGPGNQLLDGLARVRGHDYDEKGNLASKGMSNASFMARMDHLTPGHQANCPCHSQPIDYRNIVAGGTQD